MAPRAAASAPTAGAADGAVSAAGARPPSRGGVPLLYAPDGGELSSQDLGAQLEDVGAQLEDVGKGAWRRSGPVTALYSGLTGASPGAPGAVPGEGAQAPPYARALPPPGGALQLRAGSGAGAAQELRARLGSGRWMAETETGRLQLEPFGRLTPHASLEPLQQTPHAASRLQLPGAGAARQDRYGAPPGAGTVTADVVFGQAPAPRGVSQQAL